MTLWCVIPVQPADEGKSRLAEVLGREARQSLCERLFERTVGLAVDAFGQGRCIVISRSADLLARAHRHGAATLSEQEPYGLFPLDEYFYGATRDVVATVPEREGPLPLRPPMAA